jgi:hypothetical protein
VIVSVDAQRLQIWDLAVLREQFRETGIGLGAGVIAIFEFRIMAVRKVLLDVMASSPEIFGH